MPDPTPSRSCRVHHAITARGANPSPPTVCEGLAASAVNVPFAAWSARIGVQTEALVCVSTSRGRGDAALLPSSERRIGIVILNAPVPSVR